MSKYTPLWQHLAGLDAREVVLSFDEIAAIVGFPVDHAFLSYKKELPDYGWRFVRLSLKEKWVRFERI